MSRMGRLGEIKGGKCEYSREGEAVAGLLVALALWLDCLLRVRQCVRDARHREEDHKGVAQHRGWFLLSDKHPADYILLS